MPYFCSICKKLHQTEEICKHRIGDNMTPEEAINKIDNKPIKRKRRVPINPIEKSTKQDNGVIIITISVCVLALLFVFHIYRVSQVARQEFIKGNLSCAEK